MRGRNGEAPEGLSMRKVWSPVAVAATSFNATTLRCSPGLSIFLGTFVLAFAPIPCIGDQSTNRTHTHHSQVMQGENCLKGAQRSDTRLEARPQA